MKNVKLYYQRHGVEACVATLTADIGDQTIVRTLDFSGNAISGVLFGAVSIVNALQEMLGEEPLGYVENPREKKKRRR